MAAWAWRLILFAATAYLIIRVIAFLHLVVIPVAVALLLAALFEPRRPRAAPAAVNRSLAAGVVLVGGLTVVSAGLGLIVWTVIPQFGDLSAQVRDGVQQIQTWLAHGPMHLTQAQLSNAVDQLLQKISENQAAITSGALTTATTVGQLVAGFLLVLFTLFFFLRDGAQIWQFLCRLLPIPARLPVARAGHYSWQTLASYVRATVLVALIDAVGIGVGLAVLRVPLALPLAALVFLGAFIPVIGATLSGAVAVLVAQVTQGLVSALVVLGVVIAVQQLEGHVLQPLIMGRAVALQWHAELALWAGSDRIAGARDDSRRPIAHGEHDRAATFAVLHGPRDQGLDWLHAGEALSAGSLVATGLGVSILPFSAPIEHVDARETLRRAVPDLGHPYLMMRLGRHATEATAPHTPRLAAAESIEHAR